jgi:hypothetical protein
MTTDPWDRPHRDTADEALLDAYSLVREAFSSIRQQLDALESEMHYRMQDRSATAIPSETYQCEIKIANTYDQTAFTPLREILNGADLAECYRAEHQVLQTVTESWDTVKVLALGRRYGESALAIIDRARMPGRPKLIFKARKEVRG